MSWRGFFRGFDAKLLLGAAAIIVAIPLAHLMNDLASTNDARNARGAKIYSLLKSEDVATDAFRDRSSDERQQLIGQNKRVLDELDTVRAQERAVIAYLKAHGIKIPPDVLAAATSPPSAKASPSPKADRGSGPAKPKSSASASKPTKPSKPTNPVTPSPPTPTPTSGLCLLNIVCVG